MKRNKAIFYAMLLLCMIMWTCHNKTETSFVKVDGKNFMYNQSKYAFAGVNFWQGAYLGADVIEGGKDRLCRELDLMKNKGITNLRITASSEKSDLEMAVRPAFIDSPGVYNEKLLKGMDFLLDEMRKRDMKAVMVMNNYWQWSGGMAQYVSWLTGDTIIDPDKTGDWHGFMRFSAEFYKNREAWTPYLDYIKHVITRKNTVNGTAYKNDPTIMSWQLANEPRPHPQSLENKNLIEHYIQWIDSTAKFIHHLDPHHLVSTGNEGLAGSLFDSAIYIRAHSLKSIDYMTFHIWPKNWSWYDADKADSTFPVTIENTIQYFNQHVAFANQLNKPTILEEFGLARDGERFTDTSRVVYRDKYLQTIFKLVEKDINEGGPVAGTNVWAWGGEGRACNESALWIEHTDFTGDPPQEPQGLNSVFNTDSSTLTLFQYHFLNIGKIQ